MKRFKIQYTIKGEQIDLYAEPMDLNHRMYSLERKLMDPHPLLIEHGEHGWFVKSQDNWGLSKEDVNELGEYLERAYDQSPPE
ncbi:hypothetical protein BDE36_2323 [Arcticibacter tournemirensis]|uniref:Uncharacterized protein n=1 Tax=Arcticibacter tournemirensis TaxID=699437 RepID=A0A5M9HEN9_9SPHI|nr:hypothetical protein [Arcticibacter tournemirensis]KAA8484979.1 hypothetical protein F1649_04885 [Arcticibacter tournemirensis]TQM50576.1 hypothetical protein BDE36_2323 [Arcticibacter tournemirensis]